METFCCLVGSELTSDHSRPSVSTTPFACGAQCDTGSADFLVPVVRRNAFLVFALSKEKSALLTCTVPVAGWCCAVEDPVTQIVMENASLITFSTFLPPQALKMVGSLSLGGARKKGRRYVAKL